MVLSYPYHRISNEILCLKIKEMKKINFLKSCNNFQFTSFDSAKISAYIIYSNIKSISKDYFKYYIRLKNEIITNYLIKRAGEIADFAPSNAMQIKSC